MAADFPDLIIRNYDDLTLALRAVQNHLQISNATVEAVGGLCGGFCDKLLGPSREKKIGPRTLDLLLGALAVQLKVEIDWDQLRKVEHRWITRNEKQVRNPRHMNGHASAAWFCPLE